jgi:hypothetical protein
VSDLEILVLKNFLSVPDDIFSPPFMQVIDGPTESRHRLFHLIGPMPGSRVEDGKWNLRKRQSIIIVTHHVDLVPQLGRRDSEVNGWN